MKKIPTIFQRDWGRDRSRVIDEPNPEAAWVFAGEGIATRKFDGVCTMIRDGKLYKRFEAKAEHFAGTKPLPPSWEAADHLDLQTQKQMGWVLVDEADGKAEDRYMIEALQNTFGNRHRDGGTYEFVGPKSQGNAEGVPHHHLVKHGNYIVPNAPTSFDELRGFCIAIAGNGFEGIVWHHPDGRMAKIKVCDFGLKAVSQKRNIP